MTPQQIDAMKQALEALKTSMYPQQKQLQAITALNEALKEHAMRETQRLGQEIEQEPVAYLCENAVGHRYFRWKKPSSTYKPIALYTNPPQRTERPVDCERCNRLEEQAYDLVGELRVANIKLSMRPQRTWVGLMDEERKDIELGIEVFDMSVEDVLKEAEAKLKEKNT